VDIKSGVGRAGSACTREAGRERMTGINLERGMFAAIVRRDQNIGSSSSLDCDDHLRRYCCYLMWHPDRPVVL
jgi:hypothetical protein